MVSQLVPSSRKKIWRGLKFGREIQIRVRKGVSEVVRLAALLFSMYMSNLVEALQARVLGFVEDIHHLARELSVREIRQKSRRGTSSGCYLDQQVAQS
jgi:hypothetical protein